jgi:hypothetical protein
MLGRAESVAPPERSAGRRGSEMRFRDGGSVIGRPY